MGIADKPQERLSNLPEPLQQEVLDFTEHLMRKLDRQARQDDLDWENLSLNHALRGMENEPSPCYEISDLKVVFQ